jgi:hypothetical protein
MPVEKKTNRILISFFIFIVAMVIVVYAYNFRDNSFSKDPANWGALGDYFGGILNPLISSMTLIYLVKTYLSQKEELRSSQEAASQQSQLANQQAEYAKELVKMQFFSSVLNASHEKISLYRSELEQINNSIPMPSPYMTIDSQSIITYEEKKRYAIKIARKLDTEIQELDRLLKNTKRNWSI